MRPIGLMVLLLAAPLDEPCPVDWRGVPFGEAVAELAGRMEVPYVLDASVTPEDLARPIRMRAEFLTGSEVFVWLARSAGLEAVRRQGAFLIARAERLPLNWRAFSAPVAEAVALARQAAALRRMDVEWLDSPLSQVAADIRRGFGLDLISHPDVVAEQTLVTHAGPQMALADICGVLREQLGADADVIGGVLWLRPKGAETIVRAPASRPAGGPAAEPPEQAVQVAPAGQVVVDERIRSWVDFADCLSRSDVVFDIKGPPGMRWPHLVARGEVEDILEGVRQMGLIVWRRLPDTAPGRQAVSIEVLPMGGE